jgi:cytochrome c-type biogenesis protein CcmH/NrfG
LNRRGQPLLEEEGTVPRSTIFCRFSAMIHGMRSQSLLFLMIGFVIGFAGLYTWTKQRAPEKVRAMPLEVDPHVPTEELRGLAGGRASEPPAPPVDMRQVEQLTARIKQNPKDFESLVELGNINFDQRNFDDAIALYKRALEVRPNAANVRTDMGTAMFYQNRFDEAVVEFQEVLKTDPTNAQTLFNLGVTMLHGKNDPKSALLYWEKLIETNPNHPQAELVRDQIQKLKEQQGK